jgi:DnaK suppressor protein
MPDEAERKEIEELLLQERTDALDVLRRFHDREREGEGLPDHDSSPWRLHQADIGSEAFEAEKEALLASSEGRRLYETDEALRRLYQEPETFGTCERCGRTIAVDRLLIVPATRMCAHCSAESER